MTGQTTTITHMNEMGRRKFLALVGAGGAAAVLASCGADDSKSSSDTTGDTATSDTTGDTVPVGSTTPVVEGGTLRIAAADGSPNDTLDPLRMETTFQILSLPLMYESLVDLDESLIPQPRLAKSFTPDAEGKSWTFVLQEGVTFHDGSPLTAQDVAFSITRAIDPDAGSGNSLAGQLDGILNPEGIVVVDDATLRFDLQSVYVFFPNAMATRFARIYKDGTTDFESPVGTGPFIYKSFSPGQQFSATKNSDYWRNEVTLDEVVVSNVPDESARISSLLSGEIDLVFQVALTAAPDITSSEGFGVLEQANAEWVSLGIDSTVAPFDNPDVVKAMKLAVDRQQIIDNAFGGFGSIGFDNPVASEDEYFAGFETPERDTEAARQLLADAGFPDGIELPPLIALSDDPNITNFAAVVQQQFAEAGITFEIEAESGATFWDNSWLQAPFYTNNYLRRHPDEIMKLVFLSDGPWNMSKQDDPEIDAAIVAAGETTDLDEQKKQYGIAQRLIAERDTTIVPAHIPRLSGITSRLDGVTTNPVTFLNLDRATIS